MTELSQIYSGTSYISVFSSPSVLFSLADWQVSVFMLLFCHWRQDSIYRQKHV